MKKIKIAHLYYDLMNLYGENGNVRYLLDRLEKQNIDVSLYFLSIGDKIDFNKYDFYYMGTGSEENKLIVLEDIIKYKKQIKTAILNGKFFLVTGNSLDLFGKRIETYDKGNIEALDIFDYIVKEEDFRIVGEQYYTFPFIEEKIIGFQNRNSAIMEYNQPLFKVISGTGYKPQSLEEGILEKHFYGTYLLGPLLVRNPYFTDYLIKEFCREYDIQYKNNIEDSSYKAYQMYLNNFYNNDKTINN